MVGSTLPDRVVGVLGSLKLTVALLAAAIFIVFAGTLAQIDKGIWSVVDQYFRCWVSWIDLKIFFPRTWNVGGRIPFLGGWLIGAALIVNLLIAHAARIRVPARGRRLGLGIASLAVGIALTWVVVSSAFGLDSSTRKAAPFWRVTFQLLQGGGAAAVLFFACHLLFDRKAGIVLLHGGLILMMSGELLTGLMAEEGMMTIPEGQTVGFVEDTREVELAIVDPGDPAFDEVVAVPQGLLRRREPIRRPELPFDIEPGRFMKNAVLRSVGEHEANVATAGAGVHYAAEPRAEESGVSTANRVDEPAAYVTLRDRGTGQSLGTYLVSVRLSLAEGSQRVAAGDGQYDISLRFKRTYKPYRLYLYDFRFDRYVGTEVPKDYSSYVRVIDPERGVERDVRIWMNNPLRYRGDTLYQSSFDAETEAATVLQVVTNDGWMIPYVACMLVAAGLLGQFGLHLLGFLRHRRAA